MPIARAAIDMAAAIAATRRAGWDRFTFELLILFKLPARLSRAAIFPGERAF
jgi:hypothetical protein